MVGLVSTLMGDCPWYEAKPTPKGSALDLAVCATPLWCSRAQVSECSGGGSEFELLRFTFSAQILHAAFLALSLAISVQFTLKVCAAAQNCEKITEIPHFGD